MEVRTWMRAVSPQSRTTPGQAELLPRGSQSWGTHPAPVHADTHIGLVTQAHPPPDFPGITFHICKKEHPLDSVTVSLEGGLETM